MGVSVASLSLNEVVLKAPLSQNFNHKCTAFGGSLNAVATLACWCLLFVNLKLQKGRFEIVVAQSEISFLESVRDDFEATSVMCEKSAWDRFVHSLERKKKGRVVLEAYIGPAARPFVKFKGTFAAISMN